IPEFLADGRADLDDEVALIVEGFRRIHQLRTRIHVASVAEMGLQTGPRLDKDLMAIGDESAYTARGKRDTAFFVGDFAGDADTETRVLLMHEQRFLHGHQAALHRQPL